MRGITLPLKYKIIPFNNYQIRNLSRGLPKINISPAVKYENAELNKRLLFKDNENKFFVYRWINKINGKDYLGSTSNAKSRLSTYFNTNTLKLANMPIYKAILKYGHSNFDFEIIEYCDNTKTIEREQYYLDNFDFDYNILEKADSLLGYKHVLETLVKMKGRKNALGYKHTLETLIKLRNFQLDKKHSEESMVKMREIWAKRKLNSTKSEPSNLKYENLSKNTNIELNTFNKIGKIIIVTNIDSNISTEYLSISSAALALNITRNTLRSYIKDKKVLTIYRKNNNNSLLENNNITSKDSNINIITEKYLISIKEEKKD